MLSCKDAARFTSEELDGNLSIFGRLALFMHLMMCEACNNYKKQLVAIQKIGSWYAQGTEHIPIPVGVLSPQAKQQMKEILRKNIQ